MKTLDRIDKEIDDLLSKETKETLLKWLNDLRQKLLPDSVKNETQEYFDYLNGLNTTIRTERDIEVLLCEYDEGRLCKEQFIWALFLGYSKTNSRAFGNGWNTMKEYIVKRLSKIVNEQPNIEIEKEIEKLNEMN